VVKPISLAMSDQSGTMSFFLDQTTPASSSLFRPVSDMRTADVQCVTLDDSSVPIRLSV
jgi:hypothetical protein